MRVLVVHNRYRSEMPSGENQVVDDEVEMLRAAGVEVETFFRESDEIADMSTGRKLLLGVSPIYAREAALDFDRVVRRFSPSIVHIHNVFPLISPWVIRVAKQHEVPVVQTVHNYRHNCPAGTYFREGAVCVACTGKRLPWPAVAHGCYRGSRLQAASMAGAAWVHRPTWHQVDKFLAVSDIVATKLAALGVSPGSIAVKPNAVDAPAVVTPPGCDVLFAGRLDEEKGVRLLVDAWQIAGEQVAGDLVIVGDGPLREVTAAASRDLSRVRYLGQAPRQAVAALLDECGSVCLPSIWYEALGLSAIEAFAHGRPVIATTLTTFAESQFSHVVWTAEPEAGALAAALVEATTNHPERHRRGVAARRLYQAKYTRARVLDLLMSEYDSVLCGATRPSRASLDT